MNRILILLTVLFAACDDPSPPPRIEHPVTDLANVLSAPEREGLSQRLLDHRARTHVQIALLTIQSTNGEAIEDFSHRTAEAWGGGQRGIDNGVLVTLAIQDHRSRIEVGRGLEAALPDSYCRGLLDASRPFLRAADYAGAFSGIITGIVTRTGGLTLAEPPPAPVAIRAPTVQPDSGNGSLWGWLVGIAMALGLGGIFAWIFTRERNDRKAFQAREQERRDRQEREWREEREARERERKAQQVSAHFKTPQDPPAPVWKPESPARSALDSLVKVQKERQKTAREEIRKAMQPSYSYSKSETSWVDTERERESAKRREQEAEDRRRRDREEEEERARRRRDDDSSSSSSSLFDSGSSSSGSDWGGGGGGFDGGGSSGSW